MSKKIIWLWCFPQMFLGFLVKVFTETRKVNDHYEYNVSRGSVTLGEYIFLCPSHYGDKTVLQHERGHVIQSRILGWLYIPLIGIPSIIWAGCFETYRKKHKISYYDFYTEKWADKLGRVERDD